MFREHTPIRPSSAACSMSDLLLPAGRVYSPWEVLEYEDESV